MFNSISLYFFFYSLEVLELLLGVSLLLLGALDLENVELDSLGERTALTDGHTVTLLDEESGRAVSRDVCVTLLITGVLGDVVEVVTTDDHSAAHLAGPDDASEEAATDADVGSEGALLVDVGGVDGGLGGLEAKADVLDKAGLTDTLGELAKDALAALAEHHLSLVASLGLFCHFCVRTICAYNNIILAII